MATTKKEKMIKHTWKGDICEVCRLIRVMTFENGFHKASYFKPGGTKLRDRPDCIKTDKATLSLFADTELPLMQETAPKERKALRNVYQFDFVFTSTGEEGNGYELHAKNLSDFKDQFKKHYLQAELKRLTENGKPVNLSL